MRSRDRRRRRAAAVVALPVLTTLLAGCADTDPVQPPLDVPFDYQLGGDYPPPGDVGIVVRSWFGGEADPDAYSVCYVNAFQTEADDSHPDGPANWPQEVVWRDGGDDPAWPGEYPIDISTSRLRAVAVRFVELRIAQCETAGFDAVELDNLDTFTRWPDAPFDRDDAIAYATDLAQAATDRGMAVAQKNTVELLDVARTEIGFGFAIVEECGAYDECSPFLETFEGAVLDVEYSADGLAAACAAVAGSEHPGGVVLQRDLDLVTPDDAGYLYETC